MSICVSWSTEHGCTRCRNRRECNELGLSPFDDATDEEVNALVDDGILPERTEGDNAALRGGEAVPLESTVMRKEGEGC